MKPWILVNSGFSQSISALYLITPPLFLLHPFFLRGDNSLGHIFCHCISVRAETLCNTVYHCVEDSAPITIDGLNNVAGRDMQGSDTEQDHMGPLGTKAFLSPPFLWLQVSVSLHVLLWVPTGSFRELLIREGRGRETREEQSKRNNSAALGQGPGSPSRDIHNIFELFCKYWKPLQVGEVNYMLPTST